MGFDQLQEQLHVALQEELQQLEQLQLELHVLLQLVLELQQLEQLVLELQHEQLLPSSWFMPAERSTTSNVSDSRTPISSSRRCASSRCLSAD